jgi:glutamate dehydrogenase
MQVAYAFCAWKFCFHFLNRGQQEQSQIAEILEKVGEDAYSAFSRLRAAMRLHSYNEGAILETIYRNLPIVEWLYEARRGSRGRGEAAVARERAVHK